MRAKQRFGKHVSQLITSRDMRDSKHPRLYFFPNEMVFKGNVLHARVENMVGTQVSDTNVFVVHYGCERKSDPEFR